MIGNKRELEKSKTGDKIKIAGFPEPLYDRYTPIRLLGKDAFASIILALRNDTGDLRALKIAHEEVEVGSSVYTEISVLYQLRHPNVLKMFRAEFNPNLFLELEYVSGIPCDKGICITLADLKHPIPKNVINVMIDGIARGIVYIHSKGVRHYHLSPRYILLDEPMIPKISGLMRGSLVQTRMGKDDSMIVKAPEQLHPEKYGKPGKRTDLFQLGVIWYWLITGRIPYLDSPLSEASNKEILSGIYIPPGFINPDYSSYDPLMRRLLALDKRERFGSADEFLAELQSIHKNEDISEAEGYERSS